MPPLAQLLAAFEESCKIWYLVSRGPNYEGRQVAYARMLAPSAAELVQLKAGMDKIENCIRAEMGLGDLIG